VAFDLNKDDRRSGRTFTVDQTLDLNHIGELAIAMPKAPNSGHLLLFESTRLPAKVQATSVGEDDALAERRARTLLHAFNGSSTLERALNPPTSASERYGLIQEIISGNLFHLVVQSILWNQTSGIRAKPALATLLSRYPDPASLAAASTTDLRYILKPLGLQNTRAVRLRAMAATWVESPPNRDRRYRKLNYPQQGDGRDVGKAEVLCANDPRPGWEIAHLPGVGRYALDSFRLFCRDKLLASPESISPSSGELTEYAKTDTEWRQVVPEDKELRLYVEWRKHKAKLSSKVD